MLSQVRPEIKTNIYKNLQNAFFITMSPYVPLAYILIFNTLYITSFSGQLPEFDLEGHWGFGAGLP